MKLCLLAFLLLIPVAMFGQSEAHASPAPTVKCDANVNGFKIKNVTSFTIVNASTGPILHVPFAMV